MQARVGRTRDLTETKAENGEVYDGLRSAAARYGCGFWEPGAGIIHQVILENYAFPGCMIIGTDSHTPNTGGLGASPVCVSGADTVEVIAGMPCALLYPQSIALILTALRDGWAGPTDVLLWDSGRLAVSGRPNALTTGSAEGGEKGG